MGAAHSRAARNTQKRTMALGGTCPAHCRGLPLDPLEEEKASRLIPKILDETRSKPERAEYLGQLLSYYKVKEV